MEAKQQSIITNQEIVDRILKVEDDVWECYYLVQEIKKEKK